MPGRNGRGPMGMGPRSGRGAGWCRGRGFGASEYSSAVSTRQNDLEINRAADAVGFGQFGRGRGFRHMFRATGLPGWLRGNDDTAIEQNQALMKEEVQLVAKLEALQTELESIKNRLSEMEREPKE